MTNANRRVWLMIALLAGAVMVGARVLVNRVATDPAAFYRWGTQVGLLDAEAGVDFGPDMAADPRTALFYLIFLPTRIKISHQPTSAAEREAREAVLRQASRLAKRVCEAAPEQQKGYIKAFVAGYRLGHGLKRSR